jgi:hypothetical protein
VSIAKTKEFGAENWELIKRLEDFGREIVMGKSQVTVP